MGDLNGDLGDSLDNKGKRESNERGLKLLDLAIILTIVLLI